MKNPKYKKEKVNLGIVALNWLLFILAPFWVWPYCLYAVLTGREKFDWAILGAPLFVWIAVIYTDSKAKDFKNHFIKGKYLFFR